DGLGAIGLANLAPALAELAAANTDRLVAARQEIGDRRFHATGAAAGQDQNRLAGLEYPLEPRQRLVEDLGEGRRAGVKDGLRHDERDALRNGRRTGGHQVLLQHWFSFENAFRDT